MLALISLMSGLFKENPIIQKSEIRYFDNQIAWALWYILFFSININTSTGRAGSCNFKHPGSCNFKHLLRDK